MVFRIIIIASIACVALLPPVCLAQNSGEAFSKTSQAAAELDSTSGLGDYIAYALTQNPILQAYAGMHAASLESPAQAKAFPEPVFSFGYFLSSPETRVGPQEWTFRFSQKLPFFGKQGLKADIAATEAEVWGRTYDARALDLIRDVKHAYYDYYRVYQVTRITEEEKGIVREMQNIAQVKYASGTATQQDVLKAQLTLSRLDERLTTLRRDLVSVTTRLNNLMNRPPTAALAAPHFEETPADWANIDALYERALAGRPEAAVADLNIEKAEKSQSLAKRQYYPDLTLAVNYITVGERSIPVEDNGKDILHVGASINLPIWYGTLGAAVKESEARIAVARHQRIGLRAQIKSEVRDAHSRVESARELVELHRDVIIPQAEQTFRASQAGYQTGRVDFLDLLDSERMLLSVRQTYFALVAELGKQAADLERTVGEGRRSP